MLRPQDLWSTLLICGPIFLTLALVIRWVRNYYHLCNIPGPLLAQFSDAWRIWHCWTGQSSQQYKLHRQYDSPLIRLGPNTVSVSDARSMPAIYGLKPILNKGPLYVTHQFMSLEGEVVHNLSSTRDENIHARLRRPVNHAYALTNLLGYEKLIDITTDVFFKELNTRFASKGVACDLATWLQFYAFDVLGEITFSARFGFLESGEDLENMLKHTAAHMDYLGTMGQLPWIDEHFRLRNWFYRKFRKANAIVEFAVRHIDEHMQNQHTQERQSPDFLSRFQTAKEKYPDVMTRTQMIDYATTNVSAGSDTTAIILRDAIYRLLIDEQGRLDRLLAEVHDVLKRRVEAGADLGTHISWTESYNMPFLQACIKESMRIHPALGQILPRLVPEGGMTICGQFLPAGTEVGCNAWTVHRDRSVFGEDVDVWRPERWLDSDPEAIKEMERLNFVFGGGSRTCIGRHVALLELSKLIPEFFRNFEVTLIDPARYKDRCKWLVVQTGLDVTLQPRSQDAWVSQLVEAEPVA